MNRQLFKSWAENQLHEVDGKIVMIMITVHIIEWLITNCQLPTHQKSKLQEWATNQNIIVQIKRSGDTFVVFRPEPEGPSRTARVSILACRVTILVCRIKLIHCPCGAPKEVVT
jgi:hypothetical protein